MFGFNPKYSQGREMAANGARFNASHSRQANPRQSQDNRAKACLRLVTMQSPTTNSPRYARQQRSSHHRVDTLCPLPPRPSKAAHTIGHDGHCCHANGARFNASHSRQARPYAAIATLLAAIAWGVGRVRGRRRVRACVRAGAGHNNIHQKKN